MKLLKLRLSNFRRFETQQSLDLNEDLIALVGPNEAGKSSLLDAISVLGRAKRLTEKDITRGRSGPASVAGLYLLEPHDKEAIKHIHNASAVQRAWVGLRSGADSSSWTLESHPSRDLSARKKCLKQLTMLERHPGFTKALSVSGEPPWNAEMFDIVYASLSSEGDHLGDEILESLGALAENIGALRVELGESPDYNQKALVGRFRTLCTEAIECLRALSKFENQPTPWREIVDILNKRIPAATAFTDKHRDLRSEYLLEEVIDEPPVALENLCSLAKIDLTEIQKALAAGQRAYVEKVFEDGNAILRAEFQDTWTQSRVYPRFSPPHDGVLRIWVATEGDAGYSTPQERSDGLRWFLALHTFLVTQAATLPILLVDEAETHLHYDAQADLIDGLMRQKLVAKVVYTTHSPGCLPPDLGRGIRAVLGQADAERSEIRNSYWTVPQQAHDRIGYTPLLFAMGATLLPLTVPRYAVITEGPSDAILLPTLMREVSKVEMLPYRFVPGLSELADHHLATLDTHAGKVLCLADGDEQGVRIIERIRSTKFDSKCLFSLERIRAGCTLEDLVSADAFAYAVNTEIEAWGLGPYRVEAENLPPTGRWMWLRNSAVRSQTAIERLNKNRVAQRMVDLRYTDGSVGPQKSLVLKEFRQPLLKLHRRFCALFGL